MATARLSTEAWGDTIAVEADWSQAADQILGGLEGGRQVADFSHDPHAALREALRQYVRHSGDDPDEAETADQIEAMVADAKWED